jgi:hypothetical protein
MSPQSLVLLANLVPEQIQKKTIRFKVVVIEGTAMQESYLTFPREILPADFERENPFVTLKLAIAKEVKEEKIQEPESKEKEKTGGPKTGDLATESKQKTKSSGAQNITTGASEQLPTTGPPVCGEACGNGDPVAETATKKE